MLEKGGTLRIQVMTVGTDHRSMKFIGQPMFEEEASSIRDYLERSPLVRRVRFYGLGEAKSTIEVYANWQWPYRGWLIKFICKAIGRHADVGEVVAEIHRPLPGQSRIGKYKRTFRIAKRHFRARPSGALAGSH